MNNKLLVTAIVSLLIGAGITYALVKPAGIKLADQKPSDSLADNPQMPMPVINAYYDGQEIWFMHTEVSDEQMAKRLTNMVSMMQGMMTNMPGTIHAPQLGAIPKQTAGKLYVFTNGVKQEGAKPWGGGPFGFQIDVFDSVPGDPSYTPLRNVYLVTWEGNAVPRILKSVEEISNAERNGELTITQTEAIVNAPVVSF